MLCISRSYSIVARLACQKRLLCTNVADLTPKPPKFSSRDCSISEQNVLFEDNHLIVISKPPTMLTQGDETLDENLLGWAKKFIADKYKKKGEAYVGLVHRIDRPCSGVVIFAKTSKAAGRLSKAFSDREVDKKYVCVVHGVVKEKGRCHNLLKVGGLDSKNKVSVRSPTTKTYGSVSGEKLVEAKLSYNPLWTFSSKAGMCTVLEIDLETGRKHQIRAQLSHIGFPICGDLKYNAPAWAANGTTTGSGAADSLAAAAGAGGAVAGPVKVKRGRGGKGRARAPVVVEGQQTASEVGFYSGKGIALHAYSLTVPHPITKASVTFTAPAPAAWESHFGAEVVKRINDSLVPPAAAAKPAAAKSAVDGGTHITVMKSI